LLSKETIKKFATLWQTSTLNVAREYVQTSYLLFLYQSVEADKLAFKGGTALRLLFKSPRFSEDLDFSAGMTQYHLERLLSKTADRVRKEIERFDTRESKPTSGGYLAEYYAELEEESVSIEVNISLRKSFQSEPVLVTSPLAPPYQCLVLATKELVKEKLAALLSRKKPRDFFDLYFLLRERLEVRSLMTQKKQLLKLIRTLEPKTLYKELKLFLPASHHRLISNLPQALARELERL